MLITLVEAVHVYCVHMLKYHTELHYYVQLIHAYQKIKEKRNNCDKTYLSIIQNLAFIKHEIMRYH